MTSDTHLPESSSRALPAVSRRRFLLGGLAGVGVAFVGASQLGSSPVDASASELNEPGEALIPAERVTTTTTAPTVVFEPPEKGEILFPIVVGPDDSAYVLDNYGACRSGCSRSHEGVDIMADHLLAVRAVANGTLTKKYEDSGQLSGAGNGWTLLDEANDITYKFFHLDHHVEGLEVGDTVEIGQIIGAIGNTGTSGARSDTNYHLHFEYRPGNEPQDAQPLLQRDSNVTFG